MNKFSFEWELEYEGDWELASCCNVIFGKLSLAHGQITIELTGNIENESQYVHIPSLIGRVKGEGSDKRIYVKL